MMRENDPWKVQMYGNITCYEGIDCDSGLLCLDWREICNGVQDCMYGLDEEPCDLLELNICDEDEYRCMNGMCVPDEYFLDGELDCLDWSDEINIKSSEECASESVRIQCDDHVCLANQFPCGDGECIADRFAFQEQTTDKTCVNRRDQYFLCETHATTSLWTMSNGRCYENELDEATSKSNTPDQNQCEYFLKCALFYGGEKNCPCNRDDLKCDNAHLQNCSSTTLQYPQGAFPTPYTRFFFNSTRSERRLIPDLVFINGSLKCQGSLVNVTTWISLDDYSTMSRIIANIFCTRRRNLTEIKNSNELQQCFHPQEAMNICNEWNPCMSITRIRDGSIDCFNAEDETNRTEKEIERHCSRVRHHRFRCSIEEPTCLNVVTLGNDYNDCHNRHDELWQGTNRKISQMNCNQRWKDECLLLRQYIDQSWSPNQNQDTSLSLRIPFRSYCDTFANLASFEDENLLKCRQWWICATDQWTCNTRQCIDQEWLSDREWDCADGSDEEELFTHMTAWMHQQVAAHPSVVRSTISFDLCNQTSSFLCLSPHTEHRHIRCLNVSQLGDNKIDCLGAIDERNTLKDCSKSSLILGYNFLCASTNTCVPYQFHCLLNKRCPNPKDDEHWCRWQNVSSECSGSNDFQCFDGRCMKGGRCNRRFDCPYGEDEYMCDYIGEKKERIVQYRKEKETQAKMTPRRVQLPFFPTLTNITRSNASGNTITSPIVQTLSNTSSLILLIPYSCNRGVGILSNNHSIVCFCPPQYYGKFCQFHANRLVILIHLNYSQSIYTPQSDENIVIKLLVVFLFNDQVLNTYDFHSRPVTEIFTYIKKRAHLPYSHSLPFRQHRIQRYKNRSNIINSKPYSIRIEAYEIHNTGSPSLIAVWQYPISFDYLPVYRFSKVLHLTKPNSHPNPCSNHSCPANADCHPLLNNKTRYVCLCKSNYTGKDCSIEDQQCVEGYCAPQSLCKPDYRNLLRGNLTPYCICPYKRFGDYCGVVNNYCEIKSCLNNGSCFPTSIPDRVGCICTKYYFGTQCQFTKPYIRLSLIDKIEYQGAVVQYFDLDFISLDLILVHQQAFSKLPPSIEYLHHETTVPEIILAKIYRSHDDRLPDLYVLSVNINVASVTGTTEISDSNRCAHVDTISNGNSSLLSPIEYHQICIQNQELLCFRDHVYLCICADNHTRVECFRYDDQLDHCSQCFGGGRCLRGDPQSTNEFVCLCPPCHSGVRCQFSSKSFTFTLDQLLYTDLISTNRVRTSSLLIIFSALSFILAIPNNLFSFVTFKRHQCLRHGIGHYLLCLSVVNQISLGFFFIRLVHLVVNMMDESISSSLDDILCRSLSYALTCSSRLVYWLSSLIAIERVYVTMVLNGQWLKKPHIARRLIVFTIIVVLSTNVYELIFYKAFFDLDDARRSICIFKFPIQSESLWTVLHSFITISHSLLPFLINLCSTITISIIVVRTKMNTLETFSIDQSTLINVRRRFRLALDVLSENKELVIGPAITLIPQLFSLPLFITAFVLDCQNLENSSFRYLLIASYWASLTPQWTSFFLYITPSSFYSNEWRKTNIARWIYATFHWNLPLLSKIVMTIVSDTRDANKDKF